MTSLKAEPAGPVRSLDEFFALAHAIETDAAARYSETARQLRHRGSNALADLFDRLAGAGRGHVSQITSWAAHRGEKSSVEARPPWPIPDTFDAPPDEVAQSKLLTPYRALASAVRQEERAFAFWTYVSAHAEKRDVKEAAERMALEELEHVSVLRRERRKTFHAQWPVAEIAERRVTAAVLAAKERRLAELIEQSPTLSGGRDEWACMIVLASRDTASKLDALEAMKHPTLSLPRLPADLSDDPLAISELLVEAYLNLADASKDANVVRLAQDLAGAAIYRLATLRSRSDWGI